MLFSLIKCNALYSSSSFLFCLPNMLCESFCEFFCEFFCEPFRENPNQPPIMLAWPCGYETFRTSRCPFQAHNVFWAVSHSAFVLTISHYKFPLGSMARIRCNFVGWVWPLGRNFTLYLSKARHLFCIKDFEHLRVRKVEI